MGKINSVVEILKANPSLSTKELRDIVAVKLGIEPNKAYVYMFNARKKLGAVVKTETALAEMSKATTASRKEGRGPSKSAEQIMKAAEKSIADRKLDDQIKAERLVVMKEVSSRQKARDAESEKIRAELASYEAEVDEYIASGAMPQIFRKELSI
jgi:phage protein D